MRLLPPSASDTHDLASALCLAGLFLHLLFSAPLLDSIGFHYSGDQGAFYEKLHPGTYAILLSLLVFFGDRGSPIGQIIRCFRDNTAYMVLLSTSIALFIYCVARSGPAGTAFLIDTHMLPPICALVLSNASPTLARRGALIFLLIAVANSIAGIGESLLKVRLFPFDPSWAIMREAQYGQFRPSAFLGHPLNNSMFTAVSLFASIAYLAPGVRKLFVIGIFLTALVAFGGRAGLVFSVVAMGILSLARVIATIRQRHLTLLSLFLFAAATAIVPVAFLGGLYGLLQTQLGERLVAHAEWDGSADSRRLALATLDYLKDDELIFGATSERVEEITYRMNLSVPLSDIENPWLLMLMYLGAIAFPFWLAAFLAFCARIVRGQPFPLQMAIAVYLLVASTSNSFGRKDSTLALAVALVVCAARAMHTDMPTHPKTVLGSTLERESPQCVGPTRTKT